MVVLMARVRVWVGVAAALGLAVAVAVQAQTGRRVVSMKAERFAFTPSEITIAVGEEIEIRLKSDDTAHGFRIVGGDVDIRIPKRGQGEASVRFKGDRVGRFAFECSHLCGAGHSFMRGVIVVRDRRP